MANTNNREEQKSDESLSLEAFALTSSECEQVNCRSGAGCSSCFLVEFKFQNRSDPTGKNIGKLSRYIP